MGEPSQPQTRNLVHELEAGRLEIALLGAGVLVLVLSLVIFIWIEARRHRDEAMQAEYRTGRTSWTSSDRKDWLPQTESRRPVRSVMNSVRRKPPSFPRCVNLLAGYAQRRISVPEAPLRTQEPKGDRNERGVAAGLKQMSYGLAGFASTATHGEERERTWTHVPASRGQARAHRDRDVLERPRGRSIRRAQSSWRRATDRMTLPTEGR